ncbi:MAG: acyltransferase [Pseudomonadota bacterium]|nr:acyltransferase [Pseudomonadota bacterium]
MLNRHENPPSREARIIELDALRGLAAFAVLLYHFTSVYPRLIAQEGFPGIPQVWCGYFGVELFFMISGFVVFFTAQRAHTTASFAVSRFARLYPAYWVAVLLATLIQVLQGADLPQLFRQMMINLTMLQTFIGVKNLDGSYWTLAFELSFYALIVVALRATVARGRPVEWAFIAWLAMATVLRGSALQIPYRLSIITLLYYGQFFVFGSAFYIIQSGAAKGLTYFVALWALLISAFGADPHTPAAGFTDYFPMALACAAIFVASVLYKPRFLRFSIFTFLGRISYSLYLTHSSLGFFVMTKTLRSGATPLEAIILATALAIAVGYLLNLTVETPGRYALRYALSRYTSPSKPITADPL